MTKSNAPTFGKRSAFAAWIKTAMEVLGATRQHRLVLAIPLLLVLFAIAGILALLALVPAISPFIYPLL